LKALLEEIQEDRLSLKVIIKGLKTQQEYTTREPSHDALKLATNLTQVQTIATSLFSALCRGCTCPCQSKHRAMMRLESRVPLQRKRRKVGKRPKEPVTFNLVLLIEAAVFQQALVNALVANEESKSNR
jgi:adenosylcobinamide amidohydrolase